jgi:hypothetical protein
MYIHTCPRTVYVTAYIYGVQTDLLRNYRILRHTYSRTGVYILLACTSCVRSQSTYSYIHTHTFVYECTYMHVLIPCTWPYTYTVYVRANIRMRRLYAAEDDEQGRNLGFPAAREIRRTKP